MKAISLLFLLLALVACKQKQEHANHDVVYVCSMDPQVRESAPGPCPICHMPLTAVNRSKQEEPGVIELSEQQIKLGGIKTDTVGYGTIGNEQTLTATLVENPDNVFSINARIDGRIETLYVKAIGEAVSKGQPLYRLYSDELYNTQRDYLSALKRKDSLLNGLINFSDVAQAARSKMLLWGLTEIQIRELERTQTPRTSFDFASPTSGVATELTKREGEYLMAGETLMRIADYSTLWAEAQLYAYNASQFKDLQAARVTLPDGSTAQTKIEFTAPQTNAGFQLLTFRVRVSNAQLAFRPGVGVTVTTASNPIQTLTVPKSAVLYDEMSANVWVKTGERKFETRMVTTGTESGNLVEVKSGLNAGDEVVVSGAYLIDSEYVFRNGTATMDPNMKM